MVTLRTRRTRLAVVLSAILVIASAVAATRLPDPDTLLQKPATPSILITDRQGRILYEAIDPLGNKFVPLPLAAIPLSCRHATIATEDERFYFHPGFDPLAILRAAWLNLQAGHTVSGASTLTQQLARNLLMPESERYVQSMARKVREAWLAWRLERKYTKDELLALYLNTTYYGHYATGIEAAAQAYFGIQAGELDLAQCALLAGLPQWPAGYNPVENLDLAQQRQATVLNLMTRQGYISARQAKEAGDEDLSFASSPFPIQAPHFVMAVQSQLETILPPERIAAGGLRVITTLDLDWQRAGEDAVQRRLGQLRPCAAVAGGLPGVTCDATADPSRRVENAALIALDPETGAIRTMVGSPDYFDSATSGAVNATLAQRQPGSAIKPLTYALAMDPGAARKAKRAPWTPATIIPDVRTSFITAEGMPYVPNNYDRRYHGPVTLRAALANSYNIPAVVTLEQVGVDNLVDMAYSLGIPWQRDAASGKADQAVAEPGSDVQPGNEQKARYGLSLTLGGGEVRLIDLAAAYAAFAGGGYRIEPYAIERVETLDGEPIWNHVRHDAERVLDARVAFLITDILSDDLARQPAFGQGSVLDIGRPAAAKTGTTTDWRDNWTVGYTAGVVTGVWVGNADGTPMKDISGITGAGPIWHDYMVAVSPTLPAAEFTPPAGVTEIEVCADSGLLPGEVRDAGSDQAAQLVTCPQRRREWFIDGTEPQEIDRAHLRVMIDTGTGQTAGPQTAAAYPQVYWALGPEFRSWARENDFPQPPSGLGDEADVQIATYAGGTQVPLRLISPDPNRLLRIDPGLPRSAQQLPVTALLSFDAVDGVTLTLNGKPFAVVEGPQFTAWWPLQPGRYAFGASAMRSDGSIVRSEEVAITVE
jgi:membrane peptidoglycan carboxypeptidase